MANPRFAFGHAISRVPVLAHPAVAVAGVVALALAGRLIGLDREPIWLDEASSLHWARLSFLQLATEARDTHPPLYYMIQKLALPLGESAFALRLPAMVFGTFGVLFTYLLGRQVAGHAPGLLAAALLALSPTAVAASQDARQYTLLSLAAVAAAFAAVRVFEAYRRGAVADWYACVIYVAAIVVAMYSHSIAVFLVAATGLFGLMLAVRAGTYRCLRQWVSLHIAIGLMWSWWLPVIVRQSLSGLRQMAWLLPPTLDEAAEWLAMLYGAAYLWRFQAAIAAALMGATVYLLLRDRAFSVSITYIAVLVFIVPALELALTWAGHPVFMPRTITWLGPFVFVLMGAAFARPRRLVMAVLVLLLSARGLMNYALEAKKEDWRALIPQVAVAAHPGDVIWTMDHLNDETLRYYWSRLPGGTAPEGVVMENGSPLTATRPRIWVVVRDFDRSRVLPDVEKSLVGYHVCGRVTARGMTALLYRTSPE